MHYTRTPSYASIREEWFVAFFNLEIYRRDLQNCLPDRLRVLLILRLLVLAAVLVFFLLLQLLYESVPLFSHPIRYMKIKPILKIDFLSKGNKYLIPIWYYDTPPLQDAAPPHRKVVNNRTNDSFLPLWTAGKILTTSDTEDHALIDTLRECRRNATTCER